MNANEGLYHGTIKKGVTSKSSKGNPQMCITFDVTHAWVGADWDDIPKPFERTVFLSCTDAAWPYTEEKLDKLGFNGDFDNPAFTETEADLECKIETYEGKTKDKWDLAGGGSFEPEPAPKDVTRQLGAKWKATRQPAAKPPAGRPKPPVKPATKPAATATVEPFEIEPGVFIDDTDPRHPDHIPF